VTAAGLAHTNDSSSLHGLTPGHIAVLSKKARGFVESVGCPCYWIVDDIDGTKEFITKWWISINIALVTMAHLLWVVFLPTKHDERYVLGVLKSWKAYRGCCVQDAIWSLKILNFGGSAGYSDYTYTKAIKAIPALPADLQSNVKVARALGVTSHQ